MVRSTLVIVVGLCPCALAQLPGFEIVQITDTPGVAELFARMNDCGEIVFSRSLDTQDWRDEIWLYDNGRFTQITDNNIRDAFPDINASGVICWTQNADGFGNGEPVIYEDGVVTQVAAGGYHPTINDAGHMAWIRWWHFGCSNAAADVYYYDGQTATLISQVINSNQGPDINDRDEVTWTRYNFCVSPWDSDTMWYTGGEVAELTLDHFEPQLPRASDTGMVTWHTNNTQDPNNDWVDLWDNGNLVRLGAGSAPVPNNAGEVAFRRRDADTGTSQTWVWRAGTEQQVTRDMTGGEPSDINTHGEIVMGFSLGFPEIDLKLHRRVRNGDGDFDGAIDLGDYSDLVDCLTGPFDTDRLCSCRFFDLDYDRDVDLSDFRALQENFVQ